jgi:hypothetical protein
MKRRWMTGWVVWALAVAASSTPLILEGRALADGALRPRLQIVLVGSAPSADLLAATVAPILPASISVEWGRVTGDADVATIPEAPGPRIWIDSRSPGIIQIIAFSSDAVPRVRTVEAPQLTPLVAETVAQITRETATALLGAQTRGAPNGVGAPTRLVPAATTQETAAVSTVTKSDISSAQPPGELLLMGSFIVRDEFGLGAEAAYGAALSILYPFRPLTRGSSARPFVALSLGLFGQSQFGLAAQEAVETTGISWHPSSILDLSLGLGGGVQRAATWRTILVARGTASIGFRLGSSVEQVIAATLDARQEPDVLIGPWPAPHRISPGVMIGIGWRPHW